MNRTDRNRGGRKLVFDSPENRAQHFNAIAQAILRISYVMVTFAVFCGYTVALPDQLLLIPDTRLSIPLIRQEASFGQFTILSQIIFLGFHGTLLFYARQLEITHDGQLHYSQITPYFFTFSNSAASILRHAILFWFGPLVVASLAYKALPHAVSDYALGLTGIAVLMTVVFYFIRATGPIRKAVGPAICVAVLTAYWSFFNQYIPPSRPLTLNKVELPGVPLIKAKLSRSRLKDSNFSNATIICSDLRMADLVDSNLTGAVLHRTDFRAAFLLEASLKGASLLKSNFSRAWMRMANLTDATVGSHRKISKEQVKERTELYWALQRAGRSEVVTPPCAPSWAEDELKTDRPKSNQDKPVSLVAYYDAHQYYSQYRHKYATFVRTDFQGATLRNADFKNSDFRGASFAFAKMQDSIFTGADARCANFHEARLENANFAGADLRFSNFCGADFTNVDLRGAALKGARNLSRIQLNQAKHVDNGAYKFAVDPHCDGAIYDVLSEEECNEVLQ